MSWIQVHTILGEHRAKIMVREEEIRYFLITQERGFWSVVMVCKGLEKDIEILLEESPEVVQSYLGIKLPP